jgi:hypothetical protein
MDRRKSGCQPRQRGPRKHQGGVVQEALEGVLNYIPVSGLGLRFCFATLTKLGPAAPALDMLTLTFEL